MSAPARTEGLSIGRVQAADTPAQRLAEGFARHADGWARAAGLDEAGLRRVRDAAFAVSLATSQGHVCVMLDEVIEQARLAGREDHERPEEPTADAQALHQALLASGLVGTPDAPGARPLVLDADGRLYLHRYFDHERRLAARLMRAARAEPAPVDAATRERLAALFRAPSGQAPPTAGAAAAEVDWQQVAAALALRRRLTVISGGPGTGKTTTVVNLLACLLAQDPSCRIALAAPTGKAAARLTEAIRGRAGHLPAEIRARLPTESSTIHRLLGAASSSGGGGAVVSSSAASDRASGSSRFKHHAGHPLPIDALVVDEASMLDLALAARLLDAVPEHARIVLLGDKDQLSAVEAGAVFSELCADPSLGEACRLDLAALCGVPPARLVAPAAVQPSPLHDSVVWFTRNYRFGADSSIGRLAAEINAGRAAAALDTLRATGHAAEHAPGPRSLRWLDDAGALPGALALQTLGAGFEAYLGAVRQDPSQTAAITAAFGAFRVLCAVRNGPRGASAINERVSRQARAALAALQPPSAGAPAGGSSPWFIGRPVMVLRNDPLLKLFNGDIGIALPAPAGGAVGHAAGAAAPGAAAELAVYFPDADGGFRALSPLRLPAHETAFAMTVHKSQGSEFDEVLVLLPQRPGRVATRELLYTAVTRARHRVTLCAGEATVVAAIGAPTRRRSGLIARLRAA